MRIARSHRRWVYLGLVSHGEEARIGEFRPWERVRSADLQGGSSPAFYLLDSARILGEGYEHYQALRDEYPKVTVSTVGDLGGSAEIVPGLSDVRLLYEQLGFAEFRRRVLAAGAGPGNWKPSCGLHPSMLYMARDWVCHPMLTRQVLKQKAALLFGGHSGIASLKTLFAQHDGGDRGTVEQLDRTITKMASDGARCASAGTAAQLITYHGSKLEELLAGTKYAQRQPHLGVQRKCVVFKSVFRFFFIKLLSAKQTLIHLDYAAGFLRIYQSQLFQDLKLIDLGGVNGFESLYPRTADMVRAGLKFHQINQVAMRNCMQEMEVRLLEKYLEEELQNLDAIGPTA